MSRLEENDGDWRMKRSIIWSLFGSSILLAATLAAQSMPVASEIAPQPLVKRDAGGAIQLEWSAWSRGRPVSLWVADRADAPTAKRRLIVRKDSDGGEKYVTVSTTRPYFWVQRQGGKGLWTAERLLPLEGGRNFRDLGGYATASGRHVRWGLVFRSGAMSGLTPNDYAYLGKLGIRTVCDFRTNDERNAEPNAWVQNAKIDYWTRDYGMSGGNLGALFADISKLTRETMRTTMIGLYRKFPKEQAPAYKEMFARLLSRNLPLAFNCTAGKDRAGIGAALLLTALGVPYETVMQDFLLTNETLTAAVLKKDKSLSRVMAALPPEVAQPLVGVERAYLDAAFEQIRTDYGSVEAYLENELGFGPKARKALQKRLLL